MRALQSNSPHSAFCLKNKCLKYAEWYGSEGLKALQAPMKTWCRALLIPRSFTSSRFILRSLVPASCSYQKVYSFKGPIPDNLDDSSKLLYSKN